MTDAQIKAFALTVLAGVVAGLVLDNMRGKDGGQ